MGSSGNRPNGKVQNPHQRYFTVNTENTLVRSVSSQFELNIEQDEIDETRDINKSGDGDFPETRFNYDWRVHAHHMLTGVGFHAHHVLTGHNTTRHHLVTGPKTQQHNIPELLTRRSIKKKLLAKTLHTTAKQDSTHFTRQHIAKV